MKKLFLAVVCVVLAMSFGPATALAQDSVSASGAENAGTLWFVELSGNPTADGNSLANVRAEKAAFKKAAAAAGVSFQERRSFDVLFNGFSVEASARNAAKLATVSGVKAVWPLETVGLPPVEVSPDLVSALSLTGADVAQNTLGISGAGVKVAVMDTGIDYDHADLGGDGVQRSNSGVFPTARVVAGYDFVGDAFDGSNTPVPDAYPDDCNSHGTHVSGIVGANGAIKGVAPGVTFGAYRVFGCAGSTTADIMIAAMEMALADGMDVLNMSIGSRGQWPQYPTGAAATRLVNKGMVVVASIGNNGPGGSAPDGPYAAGAPGTGKKVIGVASYDNGQRAFDVNGTLYGYTPASAAPAPPTSGTFPMAKTGTTTTANDACNAVAPPLGSLTGKIALIRRGTCSFYEKSRNAQLAGAVAVVLYNNVAGALNATVAGTPPVTIPVVGITATQGATLNGLIGAGPTSLTWTSSSVVYPFGTGGLISSFSSFGLAADLSLKPDIGAPGGAIRSTYPIELGSYATISGTSMSSPHVAGAAALMLEARPNTSSNAMRARLQNSADPALWSGNPGLGFLDNVHRQGAGMLDIDDAILATASVEPGKLSLGESQAAPHVETLTVENGSGGAVTYDLSHTPALATGPKSLTNYTAVTYFNGPASVSFSSPSVVVPAGGSASFSVTISPDGTLPDGSQYGGYVVLTPQGGGQTLRVPFAGFKGDYQALPVLTPTANGFPWLAQLIGPSFFNRPAGGTYTMQAGDIPYFLLHLDHQSRRVRFEAFDANTGKAWHRISDDEYVGRNSTATSFFAFAWDGTTFQGKGKNGNQWHIVPNGQYVAKLSVLKALGDESNPAHWETWTSPVITIARP